MRLRRFEESTPNPICACGRCGLEVARPGNKFVLGHSGRRRIDDAMAEKITVLRSEGVSSCKIAEIFGISQAAVIQMHWNRRGDTWVCPQSRQPKRAEEIEDQKDLRKVTTTLWKIKRKLKKMPRSASPSVPSSPNVE